MNMAVFPPGTTDLLALNDFETEAYRRGEDTMNKRLQQAGDSMVHLFKGVQLFEDQVFNLEDVGKGSIDFFTRRTQIGGSYVVPSSAYDSYLDNYDTENMMSFGMHSMLTDGPVILSAKWCVRNCMRFDDSDEGRLRPEHQGMINGLQTLLTATKLRPVNGMLDPYVYHVGGNNYHVIRHWGDQDLRHFSIADQRKHAKTAAKRVARELGPEDTRYLHELMDLIRELYQVDSYTDSIAAMAYAATVGTGYTQYPADVIPILAPKLEVPIREIIGKDATTGKDKVVLKTALGYVRMDTAADGTRTFSIVTPVLEATLGIAPAKPYGFGSWVGIRALASLSQQNDTHGWDAAMLQRAYNGVMVVRKLYRIFNRIYPKNPFMDADNCPVYFRENDIKLDSECAFASNVLDHLKYPVLIRAPAGKDVAADKDGRKHLCVGGLTNAAAAQAPDYGIRLNKVLVKMGYTNGTPQQALALKYLTQIAIDSRTPTDLVEFLLQSEETRVEELFNTYKNSRIGQSYADTHNGLGQMSDLFQSEVVTLSEHSIAKGITDTDEITLNNIGVLSSVINATRRNPDHQDLGDGSFLAAARRRWATKGQELRSQRRSPTTATADRFIITRICLPPHIFTASPKSIIDSPIRPMNPIAPSRPLGHGATNAGTVTASFADARGHGEDRDISSTALGSRAVLEPLREEGRGDRGASTSYGSAQALGRGAYEPAPVHDAKEAHPIQDHVSVDGTVSRWASDRFQLIEQMVGDPLERIACHLYTMAPVTRKQVLNWIDENCKIPMSFLVMQPFMTFDMGAALFAKGGVETATTEYNYEDFALVYDGIHKFFTGHYTTYMHTFVRDIRNFLIVPDVCYREYRSGLDETVYTDPDQFDARVPGARSCIVAECGGQFTRPTSYPFSITGRSDARVYRRYNLAENNQINTDQMQYPAAVYMCYLLGLHKLNESGVFDFSNFYELRDSNLFNTECFQTWQVSYDPSTRSHSKETVGNGHLPERLRPGMRGLFRGAIMDDRSGIAAASLVTTHA